MKISGVIATIFIANWCWDHPPGAILQVMAIFELNLSKIEMFGVI
jgi:hypothetical protein